MPQSVCDGWERVVGTLLGLLQPWALSLQWGRGSVELGLGCGKSHCVFSVFVTVQGAAPTHCVGCSALE